MFGNHSEFRLLAQLAELLI